MEWSVVVQALSQPTVARNGHIRVVDGKEQVSGRAILAALCLAVTAVLSIEFWLISRIVEVRVLLLPCTMSATKHCIVPEPESEERVEE